MATLTKSQLMAKLAALQAPVTVTVPVAPVAVNAEAAEMAALMAQITALQAAQAAAKASVVSVKLASAEMQKAILDAMISGLPKAEVRTDKNGDTFILVRYLNGAGKTKSANFWIV